MQDQSPTRTLADYVAAVSFEDLPAHIVEQARMSTLDAIGVALLGSRSEYAPALAAAFLRPGETGDSTVFANPVRRVSAAGAAMVNAGQTHATELGEIVSRAVVHTSTVIIPAALASAEAEHAKGHDLLRAVALGAETLIRFGYAAATDPGNAEQASGVGDARPLAAAFPGLVLAPIGAATAASVVKGFDSTRLHRAWTIAASSAPLAGEYFPTSSKGALMGIATGNGVLAASLAGNGIEGPAGIVERWFPLWLAASGPYRLTAGLGERFEYGATTFKYYATGGPLQPAIIAALEIGDRHADLDIDDVADVLVEGFGRLVAGGHVQRPGGTPSGAAWVAPVNAQAAKHNLPYLVAEALDTRDPKAFLFDAFTPAHFTDARRLALARKVRIQLDPEFDRLYPNKAAKARVTVTLRNGAVLRQETDRSAIPRQNHPTRADISEKFLAATDGVLPPERARAVVDAVWEVEDRDVREIGDLISRT